MKALCEASSHFRITAINHFLKSLQIDKIISLDRKLRDGQRPYPGITAKPETPIRKKVTTSPGNWNIFRNYSIK